MKKLAIFFIAAVICTSCGSTNIKETRSELDKEFLSKTLGNYYFLFWSAENQRMFDMYLKNIRETIMVDSNMPKDEKKKTLATIDTFIFAKSQYFSFIIHHTLPVNREKGATKWTMTDAQGNNVILATLDHTTKVFKPLGGTYFETIFSIKTTKPVTKENFTERQLPLKFRIQFMGKQVKEYSIRP